MDGITAMLGNCCLFGFDLLGNTPFCAKKHLMLNF